MIGGLCCNMMIIHLYSQNMRFCILNVHFCIFNWHIKVKKNILKIKRMGQTLWCIVFHQPKLWIFCKQLKSKRNKFDFLTYIFRMFFYSTFWSSYELSFISQKGKINHLVRLRLHYGNTVILWFHGEGFPWRFKNYLESVKLK